MTITMNDTQLTTISEIKQFLAGTIACNFKAKTIQDSYDWIKEILIKFKYFKQEKREKTIIKKFIQKVTGYSRAQTTRLIKTQNITGRVLRKKYLRHVFSTKYSPTDIALLAHTETLHDTPNGATTKCLLQRAWLVYEKKEFQNLSLISVPHIYNLRKTSCYQRINLIYQKTKPTSTPIGERRKPAPNGLPGYLRVDSVHQGDKAKEKGIYHINIVDEVTQFEYVAAVDQIDEKHLIPILELLLDCFPYFIIEIHADNGGEYINQFVAKLLQKLFIKLTKSRARKSTDNALVESKNGSVVRKWIGYEFLQKGFARVVNIFYFGCFNEYLNYHRPCAFPVTITDKRGKEKKTYPPENYLTPFEKLKTIPYVEKYLKPNVTIKILETISAKYSDNEMAEIVQRERDKMFASANKQITRYDKNS